MAHQADLAATDIEAYLHQHEHKSLLRFITCGSVDDGKSTLIGRLLYESKMLFEDQLAALEVDSKRVGTQGEELDYALLMDGLAAEREQGITIDVAYRYFSTEQRKYIVADTPGHEQYTRNMVTGASTADCAVILIDARKGILTQTRRHTYLVSLIGIRHLVLAVNKMDLVDYGEQAFREIEAAYGEFAASLGLHDVTPIPLSALRGDNVIDPADSMPWYDGPTLMGYLESVEIDQERMQRAPFRLPVQWVNRPNLDFRGFAGTIAGGSISPGERIVALPSGRESTVERIYTYDGDLAEAVAGQAVTLTLADEIDISRGDVIAKAGEAPAVGDRFEATIVWMADEPLLRGRSYLMRVGARTATATVSPIRHRIDVNTLEQIPATKLELNEIGLCEVELDRAIAFDPYDANRETGGFILIDRLTNGTVGAGLLHAVRHGSDEVPWQEIDVDKGTRASLKGQRPGVVWFTGLPASGKSTISNLVERELHRRGHHTYLLDGDNVRHGLSKDLDFTAQDRVENIRRVAEVAALMVDAGLLVLVSFISPFRSERRMARSLVEDGEFVEVFIDTPLAVAEGRDPKGLYARARKGEIPNFTGIDSESEAPEAPEVHIETTATTPEAAARLVVGELERRGLLG